MHDVWHECVRYQHLNVYILSITDLSWVINAFKLTSISFKYKYISLYLSSTSNKSKLFWYFVVYCHWRMCKNKFLTYSKYMYLWCQKDIIPFTSEHVSIARLWPEKGPCVGLVWVWGLFCCCSSSCCLMTPGLSNDNRCHVCPYYDIFFVCKSPGKTSDHK